jgi:hypothetical protein
VILFFGKGVRSISSPAPFNGPAFLRPRVSRVYVAVKGSGPWYWIFDYIGEFKFTSKIQSSTWDCNPDLHFSIGHWCGLSRQHSAVLCVVTWQQCTVYAWPCLCVTSPLCKWQDFFPLVEVTHFLFWRLSLHCTIICAGRARVFLPLLRRRADVAFWRLARDVFRSCQSVLASARRC